MAKKENMQPLDISTVIVAFLKIGNGFPQEVIDFGDRTIITQEEIEQFCDDYNKKIAQPETDNTK